MSHDFFRTTVSTMTASQLARRRRLTDTVIEIVSETGPENLQMREVSERSGVALGTAYRYFASKDHLLAAAWADWHRRLTDKVMNEIDGRGGSRRGGGGESTYERVLAFVQREMRAFQYNPNFARLAVHLEACNDPYVSETLAELGEENERVMCALMEDVPEEIARPARVAINSTLGMGLTSWTTGRSTVTEVMRNLEEVTRLILDGR
ncbi:DNA-binding transcriptional regulator, AcrR family [Thermomonospora echinospora]|uniref:DNA-binding transcriptional regulator, AcrR family n=1 Tax=Thermomonospora echinospora TaxID=1992 RepID=A0A1H6E8F4_9ACTN|nr:TetR family transcriptional regulator [Thermomonospora echinospora]SEG93533.1 DNA-binding transcriptional regulator, AcrR family [Thermomonospora echinospora]